MSLNFRKSCSHSEMQVLMLEEEIVADRNKLRSLVNKLVAEVKQGIDFRSTIQNLEKRLCDQKDFLNMVVHDLRNPCESIEHGLEHLLDFQNYELNSIVSETTKVLSSHLQKKEA